ncbi:MAG: helix-turn-helix transcriptional regulator [Spirochaetaceae bacterium]|nr:helix-turn-helix transcriptional regulator [Spirochaetaceae bacterium]
MNLRKVFSNNIKFYRTQRKLSQQELAEKCNTATNYISEIETGRKFPSIEMIEKLSLILDVPAWAFLYTNNNQFNQNPVVVLSDKLTSGKKEKLLSEIFSEIKKIVSTF